MIFRKTFWGVLLMFLTGCAPLVIGGAACCGTVIVANDAVKTSIDESYSKVWSVANNQIKKVGTIIKSFEKIGEIKATVEGASVAIKVKKLTERTMEINVSARRGILTDLDLAQAILTSILKEL